MGKGRPRFEVLGPFEARLNGQSMSLAGLGTPATRILVSLIAAPGGTRSLDWLGEELFPGRPDPRNNVKSGVSDLRRWLGSFDLDGKSIVVTEGSNYRIDTQLVDVDAVEFERAVGVAPAALPPKQYRFEELGIALALVRGEPFEDVKRRGPALEASAQAMSRTIWVARVEWAKTAIELGYFAEALPQLTRWVGERPTDDELVRILMVALYQSGQQQAAVQTYDSYYEAAVDLGLQPSPELADEFNRILTHELLTPVGRPALPDSLLGGGEGRTDPFAPYVVVNRDRILGSIADAYQRSKTPALQYLVLVGDAGTGKSRIAHEAARRAYAEGAAVLHGRVDPDLQPSYGPFAEILRFVLRSASGDANPFGPAASELSRIAPEIRRRLGNLPEPVEADAATERFRLLEALVEWLALLSEEQPVFIVIDDLHRANRTTLDALRYIATSSTGMAVTILGTARDAVGTGDADSMDRHLASMAREVGFQRLEVSPFTRQQTHSYVDAVADEPLDRSTERVIDRIHDAAAGNPFFVSAILRHLVATGFVRLVEGVWIADDPEGSLEVPATVHDLVKERFSHIEDDDYQTLMLAAVLGSRFDTGVLVTASEQSAGEVGELLERLTAASVLQQPIGRDPVRQFTHDILRESLVGARDPLVLAEFHRRCADAIEATLITGEPVPHDELSFHLERSLVRGGPGTPELAQRAIDHCREAAIEAESYLAYAKAAELYQRWLNVHRVVGGADDRQRCELLIKEGRALRRAGDPRSREVLLRACMVAEGQRAEDAIEVAIRSYETDPVGHDVAHPDLLAAAALANSPGTFLVTGSDLAALRAQWLELALEGSDDLSPGVVARLQTRLSMERLYLDRDQVQGVERAREAMRLAEASDVEAEDLLRIMNDYHNLLWRPDRMPERRRLVTRMRQLIATNPKPHWSWAAASYGFQLANELGEIESADALLDEMRDAAAIVKQPRLVQWTRLRESVRAAMRGDLAESERLATEGYQRAMRAGSPDAGLFYMGQMFTICFHRGQLMALVPQFEAAYDENPWLPVMSAALIAAHAEAGDDGATRLWLSRVSPLTFSRVDQDQLAAIAAITIGVAAVRDEVMARKLLDVLVGPDDCAGGQVGGEEGPAQPCYRDVYIDNGTSYHGSAAHYLGLLYSTLDRVDDADEAFAHALEQHRRIGSPTFIGLTLVAWAELLSARDPGRTLELVAEARSLAAEYPQLVRLAQRSEQLLLAVD